MKILLYIALLSSVFLTAQKLSYGVKFGANIPDLVGDGTQNMSSSFNFNAGVYMQFHIEDKAAFQPELLFTGYGLKSDNNLGVSDISINYLALSVLSKIFVTKNLSLDAGPQFGILLSVNDRKDYLPNVQSDFYNRDFGVNLGVSYSILEKIIASFRYYVGLADVTKSKNKNFNRAFQFALQYKII